MFQEKLAPEIVEAMRQTPIQISESQIGTIFRTKDEVLDCQDYLKRISTYQLRSRGLFLPVNPGQFSYSPIELFQYMTAIQNGGRKWLYDLTAKEFNQVREGILPDRYKTRITMIATFLREQQAEVSSLDQVNLSKLDPLLQTVLSTTRFPVYGLPPEITKALTAEDFVKELPKPNGLYPQVEFGAIAKEHQGWEDMGSCMIADNQIGPRSGRQFSTLLIAPVSDLDHQDELKEMLTRYRPV